MMKGSIGIAFANASTDGANEEEEKAGVAFVAVADDRLRCSLFPHVHRAQHGMRAMHAQRALPSKKTCAGDRRSSRHRPRVQ